MASAVWVYQGFLIYCTDIFVVTAALSSLYCDSDYYDLPSSVFCVYEGRFLVNVEEKSDACRHTAAQQNLKCFCFSCRFF